MPMIALLPSKETQQKIAEHYADHVVPSNELHVTVGYYPDSLLREPEDALHDSDKNVITTGQLQSAADEIAKWLKPFEANIVGTQPLGDASYVWKLGAPHEQFARAFERIPKRDFEGRFGTYTPHLTLTYDPQAVLPEKPDFPILIDRVAVSNGLDHNPSDWYTKELTGNIVEMPASAITAGFKKAERDRMANSGVALPDGSYPIRNRDDYENAVQAIGRANDRAKVERHIRKRARVLDIPESTWPEWLQTSHAAGADGSPLLYGDHPAIDNEEYESGMERLTDDERVALKEATFPPVDAAPDLAVDPASVTKELDRMQTPMYAGYTPGEGWDSDEALDNAVEAFVAGASGYAEKLIGDVLPSGPSKPSGPGLKGKKQKCYMGTPATCKSVKWIRMYTALRNKGMTKEKAARISNERYNQWKHGRIKRKAFP